MLIGEFADKAGVSRDTVRFYVRKGLLKPRYSGKGGSNPYQQFTETHLEEMRLMKIAQTCGMSLNQLLALKRETMRVGASDERVIEITEDRLHHLEAKARSLTQLIDYLRASVDWLKAGRRGPEPGLPDVDGVRP